MSYALLFAGQASQHVDMLPWLESDPATKPALQTLALQVGIDWRAQLHDPVVRSRNAFAQSLVTGTSLAVWAALKLCLPQGPAVVAGYSVGELAAFSAAGMLTVDTTMSLASERARLMNLAAARGLAGGLLSVSGMAPSRVMAACPALQCAIWIDQDQAIFGADGTALNLAATHLSALGALCKRLDIAVASHTPTMNTAAQAFTDVLLQARWDRPTCPVTMNVSGGTSRNVETLRSALAQQISHTVQWAACMDAVQERGVDCVMEIGAGHALSRLWSRRHPGTPARSIEEFKDPRAAAAWMLDQSRGD